MGRKIRLKNLRILYSKDMFKGFTIIELLIVVSIIAILAALAAENYLNAQVRTRVSRVKSEFRHLASGIEAYSTDHSTYPRMAHWRFYGDPEFDIISEERVAGLLSKSLSTPVAYVSEAHLMDPFMEKSELSPIDERLYTYQVITVYIQKYPSSKFWPVAKRFYGGWRLMSVGPDSRFEHGFTNSAQLPYDPTNGTYSTGNLWYAQQNNAHLLPQIPDLLGEH